MIPSRRALFRTGASLSAASRVSIRGDRQQKRKGRRAPEERPQFERDELPHSGREPVPDRVRNVGPSSSRYNDRASNDRRDSRPQSPYTRKDEGPRYSSSRGDDRDFKRPSLRPDDRRPSFGGSTRYDNHRDSRPPMGSGSPYIRRDQEPRDSSRSNLRSDDRRPSFRLDSTHRELNPRYEDRRDSRPPIRSESPRTSSIENMYNAARAGRDAILDPRRPPRNPLKPSSSSALPLSPPEPEPETVEHGRAEYENPEQADEFFHPTEPVTTVSSTSKAKSSASDLETGFTSPPLLPGLVSALKEVLGPDATPTPIQSLSIAHCVPPVTASGTPVPGAPPGWKQFLLASETGSGKSIAYLLPLLQGIKASELAEQANPPAPVVGQPERRYNPRGLVLAPTHELARQLAGMAKALLHDVKLRVVCASRANGATPLADPARARAGGTASKMAGMFGGKAGVDGALEVRKTQWPVGVLVGTPMKLLEMVRGRGWDRAEQEAKNGGEKGVYEELKIRRGRDKVVHFGTWRAKPELGLANVEWVVVDEADVLFDPDFQETTRTLLADISAARGHVLPPSASEPVPAPLAQAPSPRSLSSPLDVTPATPNAATDATPINYPFHLLLTSATIPKSLNAYLASYHPALVRLASPRLHRLPRALQTEYVGWTGGRKEADVLRRIKRVWAEDASSANASASAAGAGARDAQLSQILVFCNRSAKVVELAAYLEEQGVKCVALTSKSEQRARGSNSHLAAFLRARPRAAAAAAAANDPSKHPHVLLTTSLLSRGLDFSPLIKHVFIVDEPRNTVDFLHRAGRTARAGQWGKVVVFGKMKGRGAERGREVRRRVSGLAK